MSEPPAWESPSPSARPAEGISPAPATGVPPQGSAWGPPAGWAPPAPPPRPGVVPLRPLGVGEILDGAFRVVRRDPRTTLGLAALATVIEMALSLTLAAAVGNDLMSSLRVQSGIPIQSNVNAAGLLGLPVGAAVGAVLTALMTVIVSEAVLGRSVGPGAAWRRVRPLLWRLVVLGVLTTVAWTGGLVLVLPGIFLWGAWALAVPAMALERTGVRGALRRSWRLAVPDWWRVWGTRALSALLGLLVTFVLAVPALVYAATSVFDTTGSSAEIGVGPAVGLTVASALASVLVAPFLGAVQALLYIDRRMRAEGLDVTLAASALRR